MLTMKRRSSPSGGFPGGALIPDALVAAEACEDSNEGIGMAAAAIKAANMFSN
jgi:hypothetical protein